MSSDEDVLVGYETDWSNRVLKALNVAVLIGIPYTQTSNLVCERHTRVYCQCMRILQKMEKTQE